MNDEDKQPVNLSLSNRLDFAGKPVNAVLLNFVDVFGKSSRSIIQQILEHPGETFDVTPFVNKRCKHPIEEIQAAIDGAICCEQATKLKICLDFIDEQEKRIAELDLDVSRLVEPYSVALELIRTVPGLSKEPLTAIRILSEIGAAGC